MIRHIVLFEFENADSNFINEAVERLDSLQDTIPEIKKIALGVNENPAESYHIALTVDVENLNALQAYAQHPDHLEVAAFLRQKIAKRACVDYSI